MKHLNTVITGTGSYIPEVRVANEEFVRHSFFAKDESAIGTLVHDLIKKFRDITGIEERRYAPDDMLTSDIATRAAEKALADAGIERETIDQIIVAHNFGDIIKGTIQTDLVPSIAARVKHNLGIESSSCIPYDVLFGCPGWVQGVIQADSYIKSGLARRCLVIGAETLSRVIDKHDRDSMIYADGAGATVVEGVESDEKRGVLSTAMMSHAGEEAYYLHLGKSYGPGTDPRVLYLKMDGRKIYEYSLNNVPVAMKAALDRSGVPAGEIKKVVIHQANEKMDDAILLRFMRLCNIRKSSAELMPMNIRELGNSSVATIPTLYDMILNGNVNNHEIHENDILLFASVGAGMNINAIVYRQ